MEDLRWEIFIKAIAEFKNRKNTIGATDWNDAYEALMSERNEKDVARDKINTDVYNNFMVG